MRSDVAVLFDLDGVLIDSRAHHLAAWHELARRHRIAHDPDYFTRVFGLRNDRILGDLVPDIRPEALARLAHEKEALFREEARGKVELLPGARELLAWLTTLGVPKAIVTSTPRANLTMVVEALEIGPHFQALVAEEDAARGKPDPEGFLVAARRLGVVADRCTVIEDAPAGLQAARAGAMRAIGVTTTHPAIELGPADLIVDSLGAQAVRTFLAGEA